MGLWWASMARSQWPKDTYWRDLIESRWHPEFGDRRQELVFIGTDFDEQAIRRSLEQCLVDCERMDPAGWKAFPDPFPVWEMEAA